MFNYLLYHIGEFLAVSLPLKTGYAITKTICLLKYLFSKQDRTAVRGNLKAILPQEKASVIEKYTRGVFLNFGKYLLEFFRFNKIDRKFLEENVTIDGLKNMDDALSDKNGAIIVAGHIGNYELGAAALGLLGYKVNAVALVHKYKKINDFFNNRRLAKGVRIFPIGKEAIWNCLEAFKRNEIVCLLSDRDFTNGGIEIEFLGRTTIIPKGPAAFSLKRKTPIVPAFAIRLGDNKFHFFMTTPIRYTPCADMDKDIYELTKLYLKQIEKVILEYPDQWYMFRKFWLR